MKGLVLLAILALVEVIPILAEDDGKLGKIF